MSNGRRRPPRRRTETVELGANLRRDLRYGRAFFLPSRLLPEFPLDVFTQAWRENRDKLIAMWIDQYPGSRPFACWLLELVPEHGERLVIYQGTRMPRRELLLIHGILHTHTIPAFQESESVYLARHGLLSADEVAALAAGRVSWRSVNEVWPNDLGARGRTSDAGHLLGAVSGPIS